MATRLLFGALLALNMNLAEAKTVTSDLGGNVVSYYRSMKALRQSGETIRIDGVCGSACTLYTASPTVCVTPRAILWFHATTSPWMTRAMMKEYPGWVRSWINARGGLTRAKLVMPYSTIRQHLPACN